MNRREFMAAGAVAGAAVLAPAIRASETPRPPTDKKDEGRFKLNYAPHFGMFKAHAGDDLFDQIGFMADEGFRALEDNWMRNRPVELQEKIRQALDARDMTMGVFVAHADFGKVTFASNDEAVRKSLLDEMRTAVEVSKRVGAKWCTVVPGRYHDRLEWDYQTANVIDNLKRCAEICEPAGLVLVLESLNPYKDHPGLFLTKIPQAYQICRAVGSPSVKILDDLYHQQITEGNLIPNIEKAWDEIAYYQVGDNPGRKEPTTGEINYKNVFRRIHEKGFRGVVGMEHGNSKSGKEGERAVIDAYAACDDF